MKLGKTERSLLCKMQMSGCAVEVTERGMTRAQADARLRAARTLAKKGLAEVEHEYGYLRFPRRVVTWVSLTDLGTEVANIFGTQIRSGGTIRARRFRELTGRHLPLSREGKVPTWLVPNRRLAQREIRQ